MMSVVVAVTILLCGLAAAVVIMISGLTFVEKMIGASPWSAVGALLVLGGAGGIGTMAGRRRASGYTRDGDKGSPAGPQGR